MKEFIKRTITAIFLIVPAYFLIKYLPDLYFGIILGLIIFGAIYELRKLVEAELIDYVMLIIIEGIMFLSIVLRLIKFDEAIFVILISSSVYMLLRIKTKERLNDFVRNFSFVFLVSIYLIFSLFFMYKLKVENPNYLFFLIFVIAVGDSGAYFIGSWIGKHKIYPVASPNKSLEGLIAAIITAGLSGWLSIVIFPVNINPQMAILTGAIVGLFSQISDPVESLFKRAAGKKDSGNILPGHGGFLDRLDSYIICAPLLFYIIKYIWF